MSSVPDDDGEMWECDSCNGTGIEEGREWDGQKCADCKGRGFVSVRDLPDDDCPRSTVDESRT